MQDSIKLTFSSPIVNCPWDSWCACMKAPSFWVASFCVTERAKATLAFVYSWPGCDDVNLLLPADPA